MVVEVNDGLRTKVGVGLTVTVITFEAVQIPVWPTTVYGVVVNGLTTTLEPVNEPGFHV